MYSVSRSEVKAMASKIEELAKKMQAKLDATDDSYLVLANEFVRENATFIFALGEVYAVEQTQKSPPVKVKAKRVVNSANFHSVRDNLGRFKKK